MREPIATRCDDCLRLLARRHLTSVARCDHSACRIEEMLHSFHQEIMDSPPYTSDIPRHTIILFGLSKQHLRGRCFRNDEEVELAVCERLPTLRFHSYSHEIFKIVPK